MRWPVSIALARNAIGPKPTNSSPIRTMMIAITTNSSMRVKPRRAAAAGARMARAFRGGAPPVVALPVLVAPRRLLGLGRGLVHAVHAGEPAEAPVGARRFDAHGVVPREREQDLAA